MKNLNTLIKSLLIVGLIITLFSCSKKENNTEDILSSTFSHIVARVPGETNSYYIDAVENLEQGEHTFENNGFRLDGEHSAWVVRVGDYIYSMCYVRGNDPGFVKQYKYKASSNGKYELLKEIDGSVLVGTIAPRMAKLNDNLLCLQYVTNRWKNNDKNTGQIEAVVSIATIKIPEMIVEAKKEIVINQSSEAISQGKNCGIWRIDSPVLLDGKIYIGTSIRERYYNEGGSRPSFASKNKIKGIETLIFDYPSFENQTVAHNSKYDGETYGYRSPSNVIYKGYVYQLNQHISRFGFNTHKNKNGTVITRLKNGKYDDSYSINISEKIGKNVSTMGWFLTDNGIAFAPVCFEDEFEYNSTKDKVNYSNKKNNWGLVRIDLNNQTVTEINIPKSEMAEYQNGIVKDGKFYIAISPIGKRAKIYYIEIDNSNPVAKEGISLDGGNILIQGIY